MEGSTPFGTFVAEAVIVLVMGGILVLTLRTMFMFSILTWAPLAAIWRWIWRRGRLTDRSAASEREQHTPSRITASDDSAATTLPDARQSEADARRHATTAEPHERTED
jgi:hypothetical protein